MVKLLYIADFTERYPHELLKGILEFSGKSERFIIYKMPISYFSSVGTRKLAEWATSKKMDVVIGRFEKRSDILEFQRGGNVVFSQGFRHALPGVINIVTENRTVGRMAAEHFVEQGFRHFAFFGYRGVYWSEDRCGGFCDRLRELDFKEKVYIYDHQKISDRLDYNPEKIGRWLKSLPKPVAVLCCDDNEALVLQDVCDLSGLNCPMDVAIVGVDNDEMICTMADPPISSIQIDIQHGGYRVAQMALDMLKGSNTGITDVRLKPLYIVQRVSSSTVVTTDKVILSAIRFINDSLDRKINVSNVLEIVPMSRRLLEYRFRAATGKTVYQYILERKMNRFKQRLLESDEPVGNIAAMMEEPDTKGISRAFKKLYGMTPSEYRKTAGRG